MTNLNQLSDYQSELILPTARKILIFTYILMAVVFFITFFQLITSPIQQFYYQNLFILAIWLAGLIYGQITAGITFLAITLIHFFLTYVFLPFPPEHLLNVFCFLIYFIVYHLSVKIYNNYLSALEKRPVQIKEVYLFTESADKSDSISESTEESLVEKEPVSPTEPEPEEVIEPKVLKVSRKSQTNIPETIGQLMTRLEIDNQVIDRVRRRDLHLLILERLASLIIEAQNLDQIILGFITIMEQHYRATKISWLIPHPETRTIYIKELKGYSETEEEQLKFAKFYYGQGLLGQSIEVRKILSILDFDIEKNLISAVDSQPYLDFLGQIVTMPIIISDEINSLINIGQTDFSPFTIEEIDFLTRCIGLIEHAILLNYNPAD